MTMLLLKRLNVPLDRDVVFLLRRAVASTALSSQDRERAVVVGI